MWCDSAMMQMNKLIRSSRGADKSAVGAMNRPLRGFAADVGYPNSIFKVHHRPLWAGDGSLIYSLLVEWGFLFCASVL